MYENFERMYTILYIQFIIFFLNYVHSIHQIVPRIYTILYIQNTQFLRESKKYVCSMYTIFKEFTQFYIFKGHNVLNIEHKN